MNYTNLAIKKAVEGGWKPELCKYWGDGIASVEPEACPDYRFNGTSELTAVVSIHQILLDPLFWQALYPDRGLAIIRAKELIQHIFNGGTIEQYFEQMAGLGSRQQTERTPEVSAMQEVSEGSKE